MLLNKMLMTKMMKISELTEAERTLQLVDIQSFEDLISEIYIQPTLMCNFTNYVGISCYTLKIALRNYMMIVNLIN